jgi:sugar transferase (PEP-CTERM system associated)
MTSPKFQDLSLAIKTIVFIELGLFVSAFFITFYLNDHFLLIFEDHIPLNVLVIYALMYGLIVQLSALALGLYNSKLRVSNRGMTRRLVLSVTIGFFLVISFNTLLDAYKISVELLMLSSLLTLLMGIGFRLISLKFALFGLNKRKVLILGAGDRASIIEKRMRRGVDRQSFQLHGFVKMTGDTDNGIVNEHIVELDGSLFSYVKQHQIDEIVVANDERRNNLPVDELFACKIRGLVITDILDFIERETRQIAVNLIYPSWVIYSNGFASANYLRNALDWLFNASVAVILFLLTWPIMFIVMVLIKLDGGKNAPVFYFQQRVGMDGHAFNMIKFRSMGVDAEVNGVQMSAEDDHRVTAIGQILRKYRLDELPQIYNIIRGEMGFVGPRPERPEFVQQLIKRLPYYNERHNVKPGLTGWAQLKYPYGSTENDSLEKLKYDLYYIKHRSFMFDLLILLRTVEVVLFGKGR